MSRLSDISAQVDRDLAAAGELSRRISERLNVTETNRGAAEHGPRVTVSRTSGMAGAAATDSQQAHIRELIERYTAQTSTSKQLTQRHRKVLADSRAVVGFRGSTKEMLYPIAARRAQGSWLEDVDGNRYVDITMGFGALLFGHNPDFVDDAVGRHLSNGLRLGPRAVETGEAAELLADLTGMERVAFANSGTEANSAAIRLARAATGRGKIVTFNGAYHGHADNVLGRSAGSGAGRRTVPVSSGIPPSAVADLVVLDYGDPAGFEVIEELAGEIAAVIVEPVQSRNPGLRPMEFVRRLREVTRRHGIVLMFDEMLTGLRFAPGGAQEFYGVSADVATYGKALGGGFPIGAIAGRADILDGVDGGFWRYGDDSYPPADTTFFGGTYIQHPVAMVAAKAVLTQLTEQGPELQRRLNARTGELADVLNRFFESAGFPLRMRHFGSMFRFEHRADMDLLYYHLMLRGVHIWEWRNFFLSTAHSDSDIDFIADAVRGSLSELRGAGFFPADHPSRTPTREPATPTARTAERVSAMPLNAAAAVRAPRRAPDFSVYFFGDYPEDETPRDGKYELIAEVARFADEHDFHALWMPERHFHSFGGLFPNPAVLAAALARETRRLRLNAGSVVLPLHDPIRVAEEWSMVDNLSGGRVGIGCAGGWHAGDFVFFPDRFGRHKELMYEQVEVVRSLWRGEKVRRRSGDGEREVRLFPRPVQEIPPMYTAVVGDSASYEAAARHDMGVVTNLMSQSVEQLAENIARYRRARAAHGLDPDAGRVAVLLHTYLAADHDSARREAYDPMRRYMRASMSLFGSFTNSLGYNVDLASLDEEDLDFVFRRAYDRYCERRALIGSPETVASVVDEVSAAGADEIVSLVDFGVAPEALLSGLTHLDRLRRAKLRPERVPERVPGPKPAASSAETAPLSAAQWRLWFLDRMSPEVRACNELKAVRLDGPLDVSALRAALRRLVERHEQLRTVVRMVHGEPRQLLLPHTEPDFAVIDRPAAAGTAEQAVVHAVVADEGSRRFDL
ncbi:MAG TPA: MupA/Atu3671 family FMN-dependent luciferase-like monooxygenase, partial [Streptosporangiaceae bacterium]|nr:MupA/Atu3671 family FMN-dependent luciferase-like monooxygenase [Streptosporangiaceae bacterium]